MWSSLKSAERSEEAKDVELVKAKALYYRQAFASFTK